MSLSWIMQGVEYMLDDGEMSWHVNNDMFGLAPFERFESRGPQQDGSTDEGFILLPRVMSIAAVIAPVDWEDLFVKRAALLQIFRPSMNIGTLRWRLGSLVRDIDAYCIGGLTFSTTDRSGLIQRFGVQLKANDPTWYDPEVNAYTFTMGATGAGMPVPTDVPTVIGASSIGLTQAIHYTGSAISFPNVVRIEGPIVNPIITNLSTGEVLDFTGVTLGAGEFILMDLRYGHKTAIDHTGANRVADLSLASDLSTFAFLPNPDVGGGINSISVSGSGTNDLMHADIVFYTRFIGI